MPKRWCSFSLSVTSISTQPLGQFSLPLSPLTLMFLCLFRNNFHPYVPSAMPPTNKSSHTWTCLTFLCAKTPYTCESKPFITTLQDVQREIPLTSTKWSCSTSFQKIQNSLNHEKRGFKIPSLAPSLSLNRKTNRGSFQGLAIPHITHMLIFEVICGVWLSMLLAGKKHNEADINHAAQTVDQI